jgi:hypothetical protein
LFCFLIFITFGLSLFLFSLKFKFIISPKTSHLKHFLIWRIALIYQHYELKNLQRTKRTFTEKTNLSEKTIYSFELSPLMNIFSSPSCFLLTLIS